MRAARAAATSGPRPTPSTASSLTFGEITSTLMFCDGPGGTIETFYLADLPAVATWAIDGTTLTLSADDGQPVVAYTVQEAPSLIGSGSSAATATRPGTWS